MSSGGGMSVGGASGFGRARLIAVGCGRWLRTGRRRRGSLVLGQVAIASGRSARLAGIDREPVPCLQPRDQILAQRKAEPAILRWSIWALIVSTLPPPSDIGFSDLMRLGGKASYRLVIGKLGLIEPTLGKEGKMVGATGIEPVTPTMSARPRALRNVAHSLVSAKPCAP